MHLHTQATCLFYLELFNYLQEQLNGEFLERKNCFSNYVVLLCLKRLLTKLVERRVRIIRPRVTKNRRISYKSFEQDVGSEQIFTGSEFTFVRWSNVVPFGSN